MLKLIIPNLSYLLMIWKFIETWSLLKTKSLQADTDSVQQWSGENYMELSIQKTKVRGLFAHVRWTALILIAVSDVLILFSDCIKDLGVVLVNCIFIVVFISYIRRHFGH
jgi:hypothetical protein